MWGTLNAKRVGFEGPLQSVYSRCGEQHTTVISYKQLLCFKDILIYWWKYDRRIWITICQISAKAMNFSTMLHNKITQLFGMTKEIWTQMTFYIAVFDAYQSTCIFKNCR